MYWNNNGVWHPCTPPKTSCSELSPKKKIRVKLMRHGAALGDKDHGYIKIFATPVWKNKGLTSF